MRSLAYTLIFCAFRNTLVSKRSSVVPWAFSVRSIKYSFSKNSLSRRVASTATVCFANVRACLTTNLIMIAWSVLKSKRRAKGHCRSYRLTFLWLWRLGYLNLKMNCHKWDFSWQRRMLFVSSTKNKNKTGQYHLHVHARTTSEKTLKKSAFLRKAATLSVSFEPKRRFLWKLLSPTNQTLMWTPREHLDLSRSNLNYTHWTFFNTLFNFWNHSYWLKGSNAL